jgi:hypothetical protein
MLCDDYRGVRGAQQAGEVGQRVGVMHVNDVGLLPGRRDVPRSNLLRAERRKRECPSHQGPLADRLASTADAFHRDYFDMVP